MVLRSYVNVVSKKAVVAKKDEDERGKILQNICSYKLDIYVWVFSSLDVAI
jgi:hypothetical protein